MFLCGTTAGIGASFKEGGFFFVYFLQVLQVFPIFLGKREPAKMIPNMSNAPHFIDPANTLAVRELHRTSWDAGVTGFEYQIQIDNQYIAFHGWFIDRAEFQVCCTTPEEVLRSYPRGKALVSLLRNQRFAGVESFVVACQNALGADVDSVLFDLLPTKFCRSEGEFYSVITSRKMAAYVLTGASPAVLPSRLPV